MQRPIELALAPARLPAALQPVLALLVLSALGASGAEAQERDEHDSARQEIHEEIHGGHHFEPRLRLGISGIGGGFFGETHGGGGGLAVRVGVQLDDVIAIYIEAQGLLGEFAPDPRPTSFAGFVFHALMIDVTLIDMFQFGIGPSLDVLWGCSPDNFFGSRCGNSGAFFGGNLRAAIIFGGRGPRHRHGFVMSIDAHPTWVESGAVATMLFGLGGELY